MESSFRFQLAHFYRDLENVEKKLENKNYKHIKNDRPKNILKYRSQTPVIVPRYKDTTVLKGQSKHTRLRLANNNRDSQQTKNGQKGKVITSKYLQNLEQSQINQNEHFDMDNSTETRLENQQIILQIHGFDIQGSEQTVVFKQMLEGQKKQLQAEEGQKIRKISNARLLKQKQCVKVQACQNNIIQSQKITQQILTQLKQRDRVYKLLQKHLKNSKRDLAEQFETMWRKKQLYDKFLNKLNQFFQPSS